MEEGTAREAELYTRLAVLEGILERFFARAAVALEVTDVNIAAGRAMQEMSGA